MRTGQLLLTDPVRPASRSAVPSTSMVTPVAVPQAAHPVPAAVGDRDAGPDREQVGPRPDHAARLALVAVHLELPEPVVGREAALLDDVGPPRRLVGRQPHARAELEVALIRVQRRVGRDLDDGTRAAARGHAPRREGHGAAPIGRSLCTLDATTVGGDDPAVERAVRARPGTPWPPSKSTLSSSKASHNVASDRSGPDADAEGGAGGRSPRPAPADEHPVMTTAARSVMATRPRTFMRRTSRVMAQPGSPTGVLDTNRRVVPQMGHGSAAGSSGARPPP